MPKYRIEGTVYAAGGFSYVVDAIDENRAEKALKRHLREASVADLNQQNSFSVTEVCVETTSRLPPDTILTADLKVRDATMTKAEDVIATIVDSKDQAAGANPYDFARTVLAALQDAGLELRLVEKY